MHSAKVSLEIVDPHPNLQLQRIAVMSAKNAHFEYANCLFTKSPERKIQPSGSKCLQLRLKLKRMPDVVYTREPFRGQGASIEVALVDGLTGKAVKSGSEASAEVEIVNISNEFNKTVTHNWTSEEFEAYIREAIKGKTPLLGVTRIKLNEGRGSLDDVFFRNTNCPLRNTVVRLGARVIQPMDSSDGSRIREAVSEPFTVKDCRGIPKKDRQLSLADQVSRLKNIGKDGPSHKKLRTEMIETIEDILTVYRTDPQNLQNILGKTMSPKKMEETINHAKTCEHEMQKHLHFSPTSEQSAAEMVSDMHKDEASEMIGAPCEIFSVDDDYCKPFLVADSDGSKSMDSMDAFGQPFNKLDLESMPGAFFEDDHLWHLLDTDTITRAFYNINEHQQNFNPFQSTMFCSPADVRTVLPELLAP